MRPRNPRLSPSSSPQALDALDALNALDALDALDTLDDKGGILKENHVSSSRVRPCIAAPLKPACVHRIVQQFHRDDRGLWSRPRRATAPGPLWECGSLI